MDFVNDKKKLSELARKPNYLNRTKISENFVAVATRPESVQLYQAFAIGKH